MAALAWPARLRDAENRTRTGNTTISVVTPSVQKCPPACPEHERLRETLTARWRKTERLGVDVAHPLASVSSQSAVTL